jgi:aryl-alcohol dehydrogenase-like predicted oxidoreductase
LANKHNVSTSTLALAWVLNKPYITSPLVGASKIDYVKDAIAALDIKLTDEEMKYLEEPYAHNQYGFR